MRSRSRLSRFVGIAFALWFAVFQTEPAVVHACAMHDGGSGHGAHGSVAAAASDAHAGHALTDASSETAPSPDESTATCTCPSGCTATAAVAVPEADETSVTDIVANDSADALPSAVVVHPASVDHDLPFANGPPSRA
jgi:hypothetical protein